jgi:isoquinoline 1-oxidoreductase alpha subunit
MPSYTLTVNGARRTVDVAADTPLIYVLRNELQLTATRLGCGMSQCGSCAVLADGKEIRSCTTPVSRIGNRKIHTVEGLPGLWAEKKKLPPAQATDAIHPIQQAWIDEQTPQCGYCQSGMIMTVTALLRDKPNPTDIDIDAAITNICRCGTYQRIRAAIHAAAAA